MERQTHISISANAISNSAAWGMPCINAGSDGLVAYAASCFVALYNPEKCTIEATLRGHGSRVNAVTWLPLIKKEGSAEIQSLVSGSSNGDVIVWSQKIDNGEWFLSQSLKGHGGSVTCLDTTSLPNGDIILVSTSADNTILVWLRQGGEENWQLVNKIKSKDSIIFECVAIEHLSTPHESEFNFVIAAGALDSKVYLYKGTLVKKGEVEVSEINVLCGHQDWVRSVDFLALPNGDILLASGSQDTYIRVWRISKQTNVKVAKEGTAFGGGETIKVYFDIHDVTYSASLDAMLIGHSEWVNSVRWLPRSLVVDEASIYLLSGSMDKTMMLWEPDSSGVWVPSITVGEVGGSNLGIYGALFSPKGNSILSIGYAGAFHLWKRSEEDKSIFHPQVTVSGHFGPVIDLVWNTQENCLLSVSSDFTCRLLSPWRGSSESSFFEIARPVIHGHELTSITLLSAHTPFRIVIGADEKVIRVYDATKLFMDSLSLISRIPSLPSISNFERVPGAYLPELGLSNKGMKESFIEGDEELYVDLNPMSSPPLEERLMQGTLWVEINKLYGHGDNIISVVANHANTLIASACKARTPEQASIRLWDTTSWKSIAELHGHTASVVQIAFSFCDSYILSVSKDRSICLFKKNEISGEFGLSLIEKKSHKRIIWSVDWSPNTLFFATGSRDQTLKLWNIKKEKDSKINIELLHTIEFPSAVTNISFAPSIDKENNFMLAVGFESGEIEIWSGNFTESSSWRLKIKIPLFLCHGLSVRKICWRVVNDDFQIATASDDHSVRVFDLNNYN